MNKVKQKKNNNIENVNFIYHKILEIYKINKNKKNKNFKI